MRNKNILLYFTDLFFISSIDWFCPILDKLEYNKVIIVIENKDFFLKFKKSFYYNYLKKKRAEFIILNKSQNKKKTFFKRYFLSLYFFLRFAYYKFFYQSLNIGSKIKNKEILQKQITEIIVRKKINLVFFQYANVLTGIKKK